MDKKWAGTLGNLLIVLPILLLVIDPALHRNHAESVQFVAGTLVGIWCWK